ncbi:SCO3242 family prenyltransferase [Streptomyces sp. RP5T]|uniref:SCO3242 family prenyltransferase n=1 Tax=unclassified Streptomyces TaxID=2593676 RepID=UPI000F648AFC|nr:UbiA family prenyltransferase [Streptomyces sp. RP5T]RRR78959.1 4-hydroxybenzoate polyprenyltransferase [Streptomyces sp. RP5T]
MTARRRLAAYARLTRLPAGLTVPGDILAGAAAGGTPVGPRHLGPVASSLCLYWGGMALNDYVDREVDARERPDRPVPSGAVSPAAALTTAVALTAAGLGLTALAEGRRGLCTAVPLTAAIWTYDILAKESPTAGPLVMAAARALDVLRGAGPGRLTTALPTALLSGVHTAAVTTLSRHEAAYGTCAGEGTIGAVVVEAGGIALEGRIERSHGTTASDSPGHGTDDVSGRPVRDAALRSLGATAAVTAGICLAAEDAGRRDRIIAGALALGFLSAAGAGSLAALRKPTPYRVRRAVAAQIHAMVPLQCALLAAAGRSGTGLALLAAYPPARRLGRKVSPT